MTNRTRKVPFITLSEYSPRAWITLSGCNFRCRGCFSMAKEELGTPLDPDGLVRLVAHAAARTRGAGSLDEVLITGGEPTLDAEFLLELVGGLRSVCRRVTVQTNAHMLTPQLLGDLVRSGLHGLVVDTKALDREKHVHYTGFPNELVLSNVAHACTQVSMVVNTLLIPGLVETSGICAIARFLSECRPVDLEYRIAPFRADLSPEPFSRTPDDAEVERAADDARRHYPRTFNSRSCLKEARGGPSRTWLTVFPDGRIERRGLDDYRRKNMEIFGRER